MTFHGRPPEAPPMEKPKERLFTRGAISGMLLAMVLFLYSLYSWDLALSFFTLSFLLFSLRPLAERYAGPSLANIMKGMAVSMGFGALALAFL